MGPFAPFLPPPADSPPPPRSWFLSLNWSQPENVPLSQKAVEIRLCCYVNSWFILFYCWVAVRLSISSPVKGYWGCLALRNSVSICCRRLCTGLHTLQCSFSCINRRRSETAGPLVSVHLAVHEPATREHSGCRALADSWFCLLILRPFPWGGSL